MSFKERIVAQGKKLASSGPVVRLIGNERVMRVATGVMDARSRVRAAADLAAEAWSVLMNGHALPTIDPALEGGADVRGAAVNEKTTNGTGAAAAPAEGERTNGQAAASAPRRAPSGGATGFGEAGAQQELAAHM